MYVRDIVCCLYMVALHSVDKLIRVFMSLGENDQKALNTNADLFFAVEVDRKKF